MDEPGRTPPASPEKAQASAFAPPSPPRLEVFDQLEKDEPETTAPRPLLRGGAAARAFDELADFEPPPDNWPGAPRPSLGKAPAGGGSRRARRGRKSDGAPRPPADVSGPLVAAATGGGSSSLLP